MKLSELKVGVEYAVIPAWDYSSSSKKDVTTVRRSDVARAIVVSTDKYEYEVYRSHDENDLNFKLAPSGTRSIGLKVVSEDYGNKVYWVSRAQNVIALYADLELRWKEQERIQKEKEETERKEREEREKRVNEARAYQERVVQNLKTSLRSIIGNRVEQITVSMNSRRDENGIYLPYASMELDIKLMEILVEKVMEARDMVNS